MPASLSRPWISPEIVQLLQKTETNAHRLCSIPGAWVERLDTDLLLNHQSPDQLSLLLGDWRERAADYPFTISRIFSRPLPRQNEERSAPILLEGDPSAPLETVVTESGVQFSLDFSAGYAVGLFLDQRANRLHLRKCAGRSLLNTFAYTGSFSVVAALSGAQTLSVDLSKKSLSRARTNFQINNLPAESHRFLAEDVLELMPRLSRRKEKFDSIILDPPTFSRGHKGRRFRAEDDLAHLLSLALELIHPKGAILLSTNCTKLDQRTLEALAKTTLKAARFSGQLETTQPLPDFPNSAGASTLWIQLR